MSYTIQIDTLANEIYSFDLDSPTDVSVAAISFWCRSKCGDLNNLIGTSYSLTDDGLELTPLLGFEESAILKAMYLVYYHEKNVRANLGAAAYNTALEISSDGSVVRMVNKNEIAKSFLSLKRESSDYLNKLVNLYKSGKGNTPKDVIGDDAASPYPYTYQRGTDRKGNLITY